MPNNIGFGEVMKTVNPIIFPHRLKLKGPTIVHKYVKELEPSLTAGGITILEYQQHFLELNNIYPMPLECHALLYTNADVCLCLQQTCTIVFRVALYEKAKNWQLSNVWQYKNGQIRCDMLYKSIIQIHYSYDGVLYNVYTYNENIMKGYC